MYMFKLRRKFDPDLMRILKAFAVLIALSAFVLYFAKDAPKCEPTPDHKACHVRH